MSFSAVLKFLYGPAALALLILVLLDVPDAVSAAHDEGLRGTFTALRSDCSGRGGCTYYGDFASNDGFVRLHDVFIDDGVREVGQTVPAQYLASSPHDKVYEMGSHDWVWIALLATGSAGYLCWWSWQYIARPWRSRR